MHSLDDLIKEALDRLAVRTALLGGPSDVVEMFHDAEDYPAFDKDSGTSFDRGFIEGVAAVLNVTAMELLDEPQRGCVGS